LKKKTGGEGEGRVIGKNSPSNFRRRKEKIGGKGGKRAPAEKKERNVLALVRGGVPRP